MKKILMILAMTFIAGQVLAHGNALSDAMKEMGVNFKTIAIAIQSGEIKDSDLQAIENLQMYISEANQHFPSSASTDSEKLRYMSLMSQLVQKSLLLESEAEKAMNQSPQDLTAVETLFQEMNELRRTGHDEFKDH